MGAVSQLYIRGTIWHKIKALLVFPFCLLLDGSDRHQTLGSLNQEARVDDVRDFPVPSLLLSLRL